MNLYFFLGNFRLLLFGCFRFSSFSGRSLCLFSSLFCLGFCLLRILFDHLIDIHLIDVLIDENLLDDTDDSTDDPVQSHTAGKGKTENR